MLERRLRCLKMSFGGLRYVIRVIMVSNGVFDAVTVVKSRMLDLRPWDLSLSTHHTVKMYITCQCAHANATQSA